MSVEGRLRDCRLVTTLRRAVDTFERDGDLNGFQGTVYGLTSSLEGDSDARLRSQLPRLSDVIAHWEVINPGPRRMLEVFRVFLADLADVCDGGDQDESAEHVLG